MGQQGPPRAKNLLSLKHDPGPHGMPKQVFLARFELVVAHFGPPEIPKCLENEFCCDRKWVKNGPKMCCSKNDPRPYGVHTNK